MPETSPRVLSVNRSIAEKRLIDGQSVLTAIGKRPVQGPVAVGALGLDGDEQADLSVHGGLSKAIYAYPIEHASFWRQVRGQSGAAGYADELPFGLFGENLTITGLTEDRLWIGDRLVLPGCVLAVSEPRQPCFKFNAAMGFRHAAKMMRESGFCGAYLGVVQAGSVSAGDPIRLEPGPRDVRLLDLFRARSPG